MKKILFSIVVIIGLASCDSLNYNGNRDKVIAEVSGNELTHSQLVKIIPEGITGEDSIAYVQNYINKWVRNQLMLEKAEINLDDQKLDEVELLMDNYRTSLLIFKYQQMLIQQKLDTVVTEQQILDYYKEHSGNFKLDSNVVKAIYVQLPKSVHDASNVRRWIRSNKEVDLINLEDYCYQNARNFNMADDWVYFGTLLSMTPRKISNRESFLKYNRYIETSDSLYRYYVAVKEYKLVNDTTPILFVRDKIKDILINHRKVKFIKDLENNVYRDGVNANRITIHEN